jgi:isovaleryl-CoA dehydrogenase
LGITADEDYGGLAMGYQAHCIVMEELSRASGNVSYLLPQTTLLTVSRQHRTIIRRPLSAVCGNTDQKQRFLPDLIAGKKVGALAMSEVSAGSDVVSMKMTAKEVDGGYVLNGTKFWITNVSQTTRTSARSLTL